MTKITIVTPFLNGTGGTETVIRNLVNGSKTGNREASFQVIVLGGTYDYSWLDNVDYKIKRLALNQRLKKIEYLFRLPEWCFQVIQQNRVVVATNPVIWSICWLFSRIFKSGQVKVLSWYHYSMKAKPIPKLMLLMTDGVLAISAGIEQQYINKGFPKEKIKTIYNPVNVLNTRQICRSSNYEKKLKLIFVGRYDFDGQKNVKDLFFALAKTTRDFSLEIWGAGTDKERLINLAKSLKIEEKIRWSGFNPHLWDQIETADALVLTSNFEGLPMVLIEALSHGVPVISSDCQTGPKDIIIDGFNGRLYAPGDIHALAESIDNIDNIDYFHDNVKLQKSVEKFDTKAYVDSFIGAVESLT